MCIYRGVSVRALSVLVVLCNLKKNYKENQAPPNYLLHKGENRFGMEIEYGKILLLGSSINGRKMIVILLETASILPLISLSL